MSPAMADAKEGKASHTDNGAHPVSEHVQWDARGQASPSVCFLLPVGSRNPSTASPLGLTHLSQPSGSHRNFREQAGGGKV
jgi:hypothetical protein